MYCCLTTHIGCWSECFWNCANSNFLTAQRFCRYYVENKTKFPSCHKPMTCHSSCSRASLVFRFRSTLLVLLFVWSMFFSLVRLDKDVASLKIIKLVMAISLTCWWFYAFFCFRDVISALLDTMENLKGVLQLQKNACLTLCNFKIPMEVVCIVLSVVVILWLIENVILLILLNNKGELGYLWTFS